MTVELFSPGLCNFCRLLIWLGGILSIVAITFGVAFLVIVSLEVNVTERLYLVLQFFKVVVNLDISNFRNFNYAPITTKEFSHDHVHTFPINKLIIFLVNVFYEFHNVNVMSICCDPCLELQVLLLDEANGAIKYSVEFLLHSFKLLLPFAWIMVYDILDVSPNYSLTSFMKRSALIEMFWASFTHECRHCACWIHTHWKTAMAVHTFWWFLHLLVYTYYYKYLSKLLLFKNISFSSIHQVGNFSLSLKVMDRESL